MRNEKKLCIESEEYLDYLIKLAFDLDDLEKVQAIDAAAETEFPAPDEESVQRAWQMFLEKINRLQ